MSDRLVFVLDTNVFVDALMFPRSFGRRAFDLALGQGYLVYSKETFAELAEVIYRQNFDKYITDHERETFLGFFARELVLFEVNEKITVCRDPKDNKFLELAVCARANLVLTRDDDLLVLSPFQGINIIEPQTFVEQQGK